MSSSLRTELCLHIASNFSLSVSGTECLAGTYLYKRARESRRERRGWKRERRGVGERERAIALVNVSPD